MSAAFLTLLVHPLGTHQRMVLTKLTLPNGARVEMLEQWIGPAGNDGLWGLYGTPAGGTWWLDRRELVRLENTAKGKRKPFPVQVPLTDPPPPDAVLATRHEYDWHPRPEPQP
jgi:hypothetical protein